MEVATDAQVHEPAVAVERPEAASPVVLLCDHASNRWPARYGALGLRQSDLFEHFAWDPGALAGRPSPVCVAGRAAGAWTRVSPGPGREPRPFGRRRYRRGRRRRRRARQHRPFGSRAGPACVEIYAPYHAAVDDLLTMRTTAGLRSALIAIHTYTPSLRGVDRPWHCGVIFASRFAARRAVGRRARGGGRPDRRRQPALRAVGPGLPHAIAARRRQGESVGDDEVRNDLVSTEAGQADWAMRLAPLLRRVAQTVLDAGDAAAPKDDTTA